MGSMTLPGALGEPGVWGTPGSGVEGMYRLDRGTLPYDRLTGDPWPAF